MIQVGFGEFFRADYSWPRPHFESQISLADRHDHRRILLGPSAARVDSLTREHQIDKIVSSDATDMRNRFLVWA
jgi:hypothetical protein